MSLRQAFYYACLIVGATVIFFFLLQLMSWGILWMTIHFPGAFGIVFLLLLVVIAITFVLYFTLGTRLTRQQRK